MAVGAREQCSFTGEYVNIGSRTYRFSLVVCHPTTIGPNVIRPQRVSKDNDDVRLVTGLSSPNMGSRSCAPSDYPGKSPAESHQSNVLDEFSSGQVQHVISALLSSAEGRRREHTERLSRAYRCISSTILTCPQSLYQLLSHNSTSQANAGMVPTQPHAFVPSVARRLCPPEIGRRTEADGMEKRRARQATPLRWVWMLKG